MINASGDLVGLLSQVDLVRVIASFVDELDLAKSTVGQYQLGIMFVESLPPPVRGKGVIAPSPSRNRLVVVDTVLYN